MTKYYMKIRNKQEEFRYISKMEMKNNEYSLSKVANIARATVYTKDEIILFFATDTKLKTRVDVYEVIYNEDPVAVNLSIGEQFHLGGKC